MKKELIEQWIVALRSGKYMQGRQQLKKEDSFCCLGVACDIHPDAKPYELYLHYPSNWIMHDYGIDKTHDLKDLNKVFECPVTYENLAFYLAWANDSLDWDFNQIANWIEDNLLPLADKNNHESKRKLLLLLG